VDIWKKSATFSPEALRPCYARLSGEVPETDTKVKNLHSKRQCLLSSMPCFVSRIDRKLVWSATQSNSPWQFYRDPVAQQLVPSQSTYASGPLLAPLKVVDPRYTALCTEHARSVFKRCNTADSRFQRHVMGTWCLLYGRILADQTASQKQFLVISQYHTPASVCATETMNVKLRRYSPLLFFPTSQCRCNICRRNSLCFGDDCKTSAMRGVTRGAPVNHGTPSRLRAPGVCNYAPTAVPCRNNARPHRTWHLHPVLSHTPMHTCRSNYIYVEEHDAALSTTESTYQVPTSSTGFFWPRSLAGNYRNRWAAKSSCLTRQHKRIFSASAPVKHLPVATVCALSILCLGLSDLVDLSLACADQQCRILRHRN